MKNVKQKLQDAGSKLLSGAKSTLKFAIEYTTAVVLICVLALAVLKMPELHNKYYRAAVGSKVYMIRDSVRSGGGTGFAIVAPSGQSYIMTNDHVCDVSSDGRTVLVTGDEGSMRRNIVAHDENSDLCLIEGLPGVEGLPVAWSGPELGDTITVVGHPRLMPTHVAKGEMTGKETISIRMGPISVIDPRSGQEELISEQDGGILEKDCQMNKNSITTLEIDAMFMVLKVKFCVMTVQDAYVTSVVIYPGNSGSPVVNFWSNVIGVAFASDSTNWGRMVPLQDIKAFLKNY